MKILKMKLKFVLLSCMMILVMSSALGDYQKMLVVGNSLTHHGPSEAILWEGNWGMAASSETNEFAHKLQSKLQADQATALTLAKSAISDEANTMSGYTHLLSNNADLIIIELGDNYRGECSYNALQIPFEQMISALASGGNNPDVFVLGTWGAPNVNPFIRQAAINTNATYIDISVLSQDPLNKASSEDYCKPEWRTNGVGWHPGDRGMEAIATTIYDEISTNIPEPATALIICVGVLLITRK